VARALLPRNITRFLQFTYGRGKKASFRQAADSGRTESACRYCIGQFGSIALEAVILDKTISLIVFVWAFGKSGKWSRQ
jgi:hypothetical protein